MGGAIGEEDSFWGEGGGGARVRLFWPVNGPSRINPTAPETVDAMTNDKAKR